MVLPFVKLNHLYTQLTILTGLVVLLVSPICRAQSDENLEYKIKTAYLYNFTKFIEWPAKSSATFNICIMGNTPLKAFLPSLEAKSALDKPIRIHYYDSVQQASNCDIAYFEQVSLQPGSNLTELLQAPQLNGAVTVGSQDRFAESGGMIGFSLVQEKLKLRINLQAFKRQELNISAKLIEVATLVRGGDNE